MFFMGILMSVEALNAAGLLGELARALSDAVPNVDIIAASIGLVSALIDNVPLVSTYSRCCACPTARSALLLLKRSQVGPACHVMQCSSEAMLLSCMCYF